MEAATMIYRLPMLTAAAGATLWVFGVTAVETVLGILLFVPLFAGCKLCTRWSNQKIMQYLIWVYGRAWLVLVWPVIHLRRDGFTKAAFDTPSVIVLNHLSFWDTFFMGALPIFDVTFALRAWPFRMFWFTYFMHLAGYLNLEADSWEHNLARARKELAMGRHVFIFPEGHRSRDGQMRRFHSGAFRIAMETGAPILPMCITGTGQFQPPGRRWVEPAATQLRILDPVYPHEFSGELAHTAMGKHVYQLMQKELHKMGQIETPQPS